MQRRAARYVCNDYNYESSVAEMINKLNWITLKERRLNIRLCLFYKIVYGLVSIPPEQYLTPINRTRPSRHCNSMAFTIFSPRHDFYKFSFFPQTVIQWNHLPDETVKASTLEAFKKHLTA